MSEMSGDGSVTETNGDSKPLTAAQKKRAKEKAKKAAAKFAAENDGGDENHGPSENNVVVSPAEIAKAKAAALAAKKKGKKGPSTAFLAAQKDSKGAGVAVGSRLSKKEFDKANYAAGSLCA